MILGYLLRPPDSSTSAAQMEIESPWQFELSNTGVNLADHKITHAGVLEFIAEEGHVHLPAWVSVGMAVISDKVH
jgi:ubiquitin fusion degradation protein 1